VQGAFGAWTVTMKLQPFIVTMHLLLGMFLLTLIAWLWAGQTPQRQSGLTRGQVLLSRFALLLTFMQIALGGWVSTNYATLACMEFPMCQASWIPQMDWQHGFTLWRELGKTAGGEYLPFAALTAIHWVHRNFAFLVFAVVGFLAWRMRVQQGQLARALALILTWQFLSGIATIYFAWPLAIALAHNAGATALVLTLSVLNYRVRSS
jgi:cytochrome c oxidase assembly protein subunit 15